MGPVSGNAYVGGLVGENQQMVLGCLATGDVSGLGEESFDIGGLVGDNIVLGTINNCAATGKVKGGSYVGGLTGYNDYIVNILIPSAVVGVSISAVW